MKYIVKPIDLFDLSDTDQLHHHFTGVKKIIICSGAEGVGKSAMSMKILRSLALCPDYYSIPLILSFDKKMQYWENTGGITESINLTHKETIKIPFIYLLEMSTFMQWSEICLNIQLLTRNLRTNFIVVDGLNEIDNKTALQSLLVTLVNFVLYGNVSHVFISSNQPVQFPKFLLHKLAENKLIEFWHLDRPEYMDGPIKNFGDTILNIHTAVLTKHSKSNT